MLKLAALISKYRSAVIVILFLPVFSFMLSEKFSIGMVPENPHLLFKVEFSMPSRVAKEISDKVTAPAEKVFNGLPGLIGIQSTTESHKAAIYLRFHEGLEESAIYLNIQEKMDRIRLMLPGDVDSYRVTREKVERPADIQFDIEGMGGTTGKLSEVLLPYQMVISKTVPDLSNSGGVKVSVDPVKLAANKVSVSEVVSALKALGISTAMGRTNGVMFETGKVFKNISDVKGALVGANGHRPIKLEDVAEITVLASDPVKSIQIWTDPERANNGQIIDALERAFESGSVGRPLWKAILRQTVQPAILIMLVFVLNLYVIRVLRMPLISMVFLAATGGLTIVHFLFWKGLLRPPLTVLDLHGLAYTLIIGSMFLSVLYIRIRSFFAEERIGKGTKTLEQAKLFSLAELVPTFLTLVIAMWIMALPTMTTAVNVPSRVILESMFYVGFPVLFFIVTFMLLTSPGEFLTRQIKNTSLVMHWQLSRKKENLAVWTLSLLTIMAFSIFLRTDVGVGGTTDEKSLTVSEQMVRDLRGYGDSLIYRTEGIDSDLAQFNGFVPKLASLSSPAMVYDFSSSGLRYLGNVDLVGFSEALKSLQGQFRFGNIIESNSSESLAVRFSQEKLQFSDVSNLLLSTTDRSNQRFKLGNLMNSRLTEIPTRIVRDNMTEGHRVTSVSKNKGIFKKELPQELLATPWDAYLINQFDRYQSFHAVSLVFLFLLFSIYLNSFVRSFLVVVFALATAGFSLIAHFISPFVMHSDSLWLINVGAFMALFQILVSARIIDIERSRGIDRDICVKHVREQIAPGVYLCSWSFVIAIGVAGLSEFFPGLPTLGFWREAVFMSLLTGVILVFSTHILFPIFYLRSEEVVNEIAFKLYKWNPLRKR